MRSGTTGTVVRGVVLAVVGGAALLSAQPPSAFPPVFDPNVEQTQRLEPPVPPTTAPNPRNPTAPTVPTGVIAGPARGSAPVVDPPPPVLQLAVRTPAHVPVGKPVSYKITVSNSSNAKALRVRVRMPWPDGAAAITKCEPKPEGWKEVPPAGAAPVKEMFWEVGDLQRGESKTYDMAFTPAADAKKVAGTAYVSFEYGAKVETAIDVPKLEVTKTADQKVAVGELITVRVRVTNPTPVAIPNVKLTEGVPAVDAEYRGDDKAEKVAGQDGVRAWNLGTIAAGSYKEVQYQLHTRKAGELSTYSTAASADVPTATARADSRSKVLQPGLHLAFTGTPAAAPKAPAQYQAVVKNTGTLDLTDVKVAVEVPDELTVTKRRNGAKADSRGRTVWTIPKLAAGESEVFTLQAEPESGVAGKKLLKASAWDGRGLVQPQTAEAGTEFVGKADLTWKPTFDRSRVQVGHQGTITVVVKNQGAESDKGVRLRVTLPPEVKYIDNGPLKASLHNAEVLFEPQPLGPNKTVEFTLTFEGKTPGKGYFTLLLEGESLGGKPLTKEQEVTVER